MPNTSYTQQKLASATQTHARVRAALATVAFQVIAEGRNTADEIKRYDYATNVVLLNLSAVAVQISPWLVQRTNLMGADTTYDFQADAAVTAATDAAIESQIYTDWNVLAGVTS
jgi:hypothetical protein